MESKPSKVPGAKEDGDSKHRLEDEPTRMHRRRIDACNKIICFYAKNDYPFSEEQQDEVDKMLKEAQSPVEVPTELAEDHEWNGKDDDIDNELGADEARRYRAITTRLNY